MQPGGATVAVRGNAMFFRRFEVTVVEGPDRGTTVTSSDDELTIGTAAGCGLRLTDGAVSRHHCALRVSARGLELRDLGSTNGTFTGDAEMVRGYVKSGARIRVGTSVLALAIRDDEVEAPLAASDRFGELVGASPQMRWLFALLERFAQSDSTVLLRGETGTGKELVAEAIHAASQRNAGPFVVVDCSALQRDLAESELFGHVRGAFTGADTDRVGAFEAAHGGTVFLDEIAELPRALQPLLLRVLESRTIRRVGTHEPRPIDVRVIAASHRDLRALVNEKRFRADLFYRLDVLRAVVPPLRERTGDVELLARHFWTTRYPERPFPPELVRELEQHDWPGNVRELRNAVERAGLVSEPEPTEDEALSYGEARDRVVARWERGWLLRLLEAHDHNLVHAARAARMGRSNLRALARKHGLRGDEP